MSELIEFAPRWHYLGILALCLLLTAPLEIVIGARVYRRPKRLLIALAGSVPFVIWDVFATRAGHWWFSERHTLGPSIAGLPLEELLFFVVVPICGILTYEAVQRVTAAGRRARRRNDEREMQEVG